MFSALLLVIGGVGGRHYKVLSAGLVFRKIARRRHGFEGEPNCVATNCGSFPLPGWLGCYLHFNWLLCEQTLGPFRGPTELGKKFVGV